MKIVSIYFPAPWATDVSPPNNSVFEKAACGKNAFQGPSVLRHQFTIITRSFVKTEMFNINFAVTKRTAQDIQPNCLTPKRTHAR